MKVLVTGGCGFIGSNLVEELIRLGHSVTSVDDMSGSREDSADWMSTLPGVNFIQSCFSDKSVLKLIKDGSFDFVFHVAAIPRVSFSVENPWLTTDTNVNKTVKLIESCIGNVDRFIFSSSSSVYGGADLLPTPTDYPKDPKSPYAWQKDSIEELLSIMCQLHGNFDATSLRYFNVFGPGQFGSSAYATAISAWCHSIKSDLPLRKDGDGHQSRDLCYIDNVVDANIRSMMHTGDLSGSRFNVACGDRISNNEILDHFKSVYPDLKIKLAPFRPGDVMHTQADISESTKQLGYRPLVMFWDGLKRTFDWWGI